MALLVLSCVPGWERTGVRPKDLMWANTRSDPAERDWSCPGCVRRRGVAGTRVGSVWGPGDASLGLSRGRSAVHGRERLHQARLVRRPTPCCAEHHI